MQFLHSLAALLFKSVLVQTDRDGFHSIFFHALSLLSSLFINEICVDILFHDSEMKGFLGFELLHREFL